MKKAVSLILALVMALSLSVPAFAANNDKSGDTTITATKAAPFSYEIVYPTTVPTITAAGVYEVGQAKVKDVVSATDKTVISYTATTTAFKLSTDDSKTMAATYYTEQTATNTFPTTAVKVYENNTYAESLLTMWVKIAEDDWTNAAAGTYTATVTFNFTSEEKAAGTPIPAGGVYQIKNGSTLTGDNGDSFPETVSDEDVYTYGDYYYSYDGESWKVGVNNAMKSSYGTPLGSVYLDIPVSFENTFYGSSNLLTAPAIPEGVTNMSYCFYECSSLTTAPVIPESVIDMESCFDSCHNLQGTIVINANPESYDYCFYDAGKDGSGIVLTGSSTILNEIAAAHVNDGKVTVGN